MLRSGMTGRRRVVTLFGSVGLMVILALAVIGPPMALAQATRTWVSGVGDDVNPCSRTAPCKTFPGAISKTAAGGEINCLDPAGFGAVTITKSITIDCTGTLGGILASSTTGVIVNIAGGIVTLRGLEINGGPPNLPGVNGVRILAAAAVHIIDTTIYNFNAVAPNGHGILINNTSTTIEVTVTNSHIHNNAANGIFVAPTVTGAARVTLTGVRLENNGGSGLRIDTTGNTTVAPTIPDFVSVYDSSASGNTSHGFAAVCNPALAVMMIDSSTASFNGQGGITASGNTCTVRVGRSLVTGNNVGTNQLGGAVFETYQTNQILSNTTDLVGVRTPINQQ